MSLDLLNSLNTGDDVPASYLVVKLAGEAHIGLTGNEYGNQVVLSAATWDAENGLVVTDGLGQRFRLRVVAEHLNAPRVGLLACFDQCSRWISEETPTGPISTRCRLHVGHQGVCQGPLLSGDVT